MNEIGKLMRAPFYLLLFSMLVLSSCKKEEKEQESDSGTVRVRMSAYFGQEAFAVGNVYTNVSGYRVRVDELKFYVSEMSVIREDGSLLPLIDVDLMDMASGGTTREMCIPAGSYRGIQWSVGVPPELNKDQDPTVYPNSHPLSVNGSEGMFWSWNTGYIFVKFDGKSDLTGEEGNEILAPFAFHCGEDILYRTHVMDNHPFSVSGGGVEELNINFQVDEFFYSQTDTIDLAINYLTHTSGNLPLAERFTNLFNESISIE